MDTTALPTTLQQFYIELTTLSGADLQQFYIESTTLSGRGFRAPTVILWSTQMLKFKI